MDREDYVDIPFIQLVAQAFWIVTAIVIGWRFRRFTRRSAVQADLVRASFPEIRPPSFRIHPLVTDRCPTSSVLARGSLRQMDLRWWCPSWKSKDPPYAEGAKASPVASPVASRFQPMSRKPSLRLAHPLGEPEARVTDHWLRSQCHD